MKRYNFSQDNDSKSINLSISKELYERIMTLCNITELTMTSVCRYLLKRGVTDMEKKLIELADKKVAGPVIGSGDQNE